MADGYWFAALEFWLRSAMFVMRPYIQHQTKEQFKLSIHTELVLGMLSSEFSSPQSKDLVLLVYMLSTDLWSEGMVMVMNRKPKKGG